MAIVARFEAFESKPGGRLFIGFVLTALMVSAMLLWWFVFGFWDTLFDPGMPLGISHDGRNHVTLVVVLVFVIIARRWVKREEERALAQFGADSTLSREVVSEMIRRAFLSTPRARAVSTSSGILVGIVIIALTSGGRAYEQIDDFAGLAGQRPALAVAMTLFMLALIGIPGTAGFFGKFHLFAAAIGGGEIGLVVLAVLGSAASVFYYLRVPVAMYMREVPRLASGEPASNELVVLCVCGAATLYLGFFPNPELPGVSLSLLDALRVAWPLR